MKKTTVIIDRQKWSRGELGDNALLVNRTVIRNAKSSAMPAPEYGKMCCLGFACKALGLSDRQISGKALPGFTGKILPGLTEKGLHGVRDTGFSDEAASINDRAYITDREREKQLKALARENGFIFKFIN